MSASGTPQKKLGRFEVKNVPDEILARLAQPAKQVRTLASIVRAVPCPYDLTDQPTKPTPFSNRQQAAP